jgi:hypothetical protein
LLLFSRLYDPGPVGLVRYGNGPADGFYPTSFLAALAVLFLAVAALPASVLRNNALLSVCAAEDFVTDRDKIVPGTFETGTEFPGITVDSHAKPAMDALSAAAIDINIRAVPEPEGPVLSAIRRLAELSMNPGVWLAALTPAVWSLLIWHVQPPRRRRSRKHRYRRSLS